MPQRAIAYLVSPELTDALKTLVSDEEYEELFETLFAQATRVEPGFPHSGYVLSVLSEFLAEQKIALPIDAKWLGEEVFEESEQSWLLCVETRQAAPVLEQLDRLQSSEDDLRHYYEAFDEETNPESGKMMAEGVAYLQNALRALKTPGQWLIVVIG